VWAYLDHRGPTHLHARRGAASGRARAAAAHARGAADELQVSSDPRVNSPGLAPPASPPTRPRPQLGERPAACRRAGAGAGRGAARCRYAGAAGSGAAAVWPSSYTAYLGWLQRRSPRL
jgi:hypothetical protein